VFSTGGNGLYDVFGVLRDDDPDRNLTVDRVVRRIKGPAAAVEAHFTVKPIVPKFSRQSYGLGAQRASRTISRAPLISDYVSH
jgi:hypothetical protein